MKIDYHHNFLIHNHSEKKRDISENTLGGKIGSHTSIQEYFSGIYESNLFFSTQALKSYIRFREFRDAISYFSGLCDPEHVS